MKVKGRYSRYIPAGGKHNRNNRMCNGFNAYNGNCIGFNLNCHGLGGSLQEFFLPSITVILSLVDTIKNVGYIFIF